MAHNLKLPPMDALQAVLAANAMGSFTAAADELNITHGAVSRRVASVEHWAGFALFERHGRGVRLTFEGQHLVAHIERALVLLDDARARRHDVELDVVRVGVIPSFARLWLLPNLESLEGTPADLRIELDVDHRLMTLSDARIAIRFGHGDWPGVSAVPLFEETTYPVASREVASEIGPGASAATLLRYPLIHDPSDVQWRIWFSSCGIDYERRSQDRVFTDYDVALLAAAEGHGITLLRDPYGKRMCDRLGLRPVSAHRVTNTRKFFVVTRSGPVPRAVKRLVDRFLMLAKSAALGDRPNGSARRLEWPRQAET